MNKDEKEEKDLNEDYKNLVTSAENAEETSTDERIEQGKVDMERFKPDTAASADFHLVGLSLVKR